LVLPTSQWVKIEPAAVKVDRVLEVLGIVGITGTPVIDPATNTLYVVAMTKDVSGSTVTYHQRLHALETTTGAEKLGGPVDIRAAVPGTGDASVKGIVNFDPKQHLQRPALLLDHGFVYISWASHSDHRPYHGWVMAYDARTLRQAAVLNDTPNGNEGAFGLAAAAPPPTPRETYTSRPATAPSTPPAPASTGATASSSFPAARWPSPTSSRRMTRRPSNPRTLTSAPAACSCSPTRRARTRMK
jgi:hypothetical protein